MNNRGMIYLMEGGILVTTGNVINYTTENIKTVETFHTFR